MMIPWPSLGWYFTATVLGLLFGFGLGSFQ